MYDIMMDGVPVGQAEVLKDGLYYHFVCTCTPKNEGIHRIHVLDGANVRDLGICVPDGDGFRLSTRVPAKYFRQDELSFELVGESRLQKTIAVKDDEPFEHLDQLNAARLQNTNGQPEIILSPAQDLPDSDPSQEYPHIWEQP